VKHWKKLDKKGTIMKILNIKQLKKIMSSIDILPAIEAGFIAYSQGKAVIPPVAEMLFDEPPGDVHIKYGYFRDDDFYVIKVASGFYDNPKLGLSSSNGMMLLFSQKTGQIKCILLDEGYLTNIRTAAAGAVAAKYLAPKKVKRIGIIGAGIQGRLQLHYLKSITNCRDVMVWGINDMELDLYKNEMEPFGYKIETTFNTGEIANSCNLIVTVTPSKKPLLNGDDIRTGTHITAVGSDTPEKQELDSRILKIADVVVADSMQQCMQRGEIFHAIQNNHIRQEKPVELGNIISGKDEGRTSENQITIADLTGVAVQDIQISKTVYNASHI
jgi:ornithine cyclodeaminase